MTGHALFTPAQQPQSGFPQPSEPSEPGLTPPAGGTQPGSTATADPGVPIPPNALQSALEQIASGADELDRDPAFPVGAFRALANAGVLGITLPGSDGRRIGFGEELALLAQVSRADGSVGRILDGHFNAVERLSVACPDALDAGERSAIAGGELLLGVWGADPAPGEGEPARLFGAPDGLLLHGVKTYCSGAGGVRRALVVARDEAQERRLAYVDLDDGVSVDRTWYRGEGLRASESHRVVFDGATVLALLGGPGEMLREPWFSRDAIRTSATWAGIAQSVASAALRFLHEREEPGEIVALAAGRMCVALRAVELWTEHAAQRAQSGAPLSGTAIEARWAIAAACRQIAADGALACGSRPLATGGALSRGRRDLDLFLLQHRLEPLLARHGAGAVGGVAAK